MAKLRTNASTSPHLSRSALFYVLLPQKGSPNCVRTRNPLHRTHVRPRAEYDCLCFFFVPPYRIRPGRGIHFSTHDNRLLRDSYFKLQDDVRVQAVCIDVFVFTLPATWANQGAEQVHSLCSTTTFSTRTISLPDPPLSLLHILFLRLYVLLGFLWPFLLLVFFRIIGSRLGQNFFVGGKR